MAGLYAVPLYLIPVTPAQNQSFGINLNGTVYRVRLMFNDISEPGFWVLDIGDVSGVPIVCGIPVYTGQNLLDSHMHLGIGGGGAIFCFGGGQGPSEVPSFAGLGEAWQLYFSPPTHPYAGFGLATIPPAFQPRGAVVPLEAVQ